MGAVFGAEVAFCFAGLGFDFAGGYFARDRFCAGASSLVFFFCAGFLETFFAPLFLAGFFAVLFAFLALFFFTPFFAAAALATRRDTFFVFLFFEGFFLEATTNSF
jgi:hypothetical protein